MVVYQQSSVAARMTAGSLRSLLFNGNLSLNQYLVNALQRLTARGPFLCGLSMVSPCVSLHVWSSFLPESKPFIKVYKRLLVALV